MGSGQWVDNGYGPHADLEPFKDPELFNDPELRDLDNDRVLGLADEVERARVVQLCGLVAVSEEASFLRDGATSLSAWLVTRGGVSVGDAHRLARLVGILRRLPQLLAALKMGHVRVAHLEALARVATDRRAAALELFATQLVAHACALGPDDYRKLCQRWAELADEHLAEPAGGTGHYSLRLTPSLFGEADITGHLTADQADVVARVLDELNGPDPADAPVQRTVGQPTADALADLAHHFLNEPPSKDSRPGTKANGWGSAPPRPARRAKPTAVLTIDLDTALDRSRELAFPDVGSQPDLAAVRCELLGGGVLPRSITELLACDAHLRRVIVDAHGQPLNVGRPVAAVSEAQRIALHVRDGGCQFPTCARPAHWCDAHHVVPRSQGGCTDVANLVLLCRRHHRLIHGSRWDLVRDPTTGQVSAIRSDGAVYRRQHGIVEITEPQDLHTLDPPLRL